MVIVHGMPPGITASVWVIGLLMINVPAIGNGHRDQQFRRHSRELAASGP